MNELASAQDYVVEYIRASLELLDDEDEGMTHWLAQMYIRCCRIGTGGERVTEIAYYVKHRR